MSPAESMDIERRRETVTRDDIANIVGKITDVENAFVQCQQRISKAVEERIGEHSAIRELRDSIEDLKSRIFDAVRNGDGRLEGHDGEIKQLKSRVESLEHAVEQIMQRLGQVEFTVRATKLAVEDTARQTQKSVASVNDSVNSLHDTVNHVIAMSISKSSATGVQFSKIPAIAWPVFGVVSIAVIAAATGHMGAFIGWLGTIKIFGA
jgi:predicted  nucleic acid-binding Zn-ribbon protein